MSEYNRVEQRVTPDMPKTVPNEVLHIYVPKATYKIPGIASFSEECFTLTPNGEVRLPGSIVDAIKNAAPKTYVDDLLKWTVDNINKSLNKKLDLNTSKTDYPTAYVKTPDGTQTTIDISSSGKPGAIVALNSNGQCSITTPTENGHVANKEYVDTVADGKLDKFKSDTGVSQVYSVSSEGTQQMTPYTIDSVGGTLVYRDSEGRAYVKDPDPDGYGGQIANKRYVDTEIAKFDFIKVVNKLPEREDALPNKIYLVPKEDNQNKDFFDEWVWIDKGTEASPYFDWEWITTKQIEVDLTPYATTLYVDERVNIDEDTLNTMLEEVYS